MGVRYCDFRELDKGDFDAVVVGSGFAGAVAARELAERGGRRVLVPLVDALVVGLDEDARRIDVDLPDGLLDL